jgi:hypothetical protein
MLFGLRELYVYRQKQEAVVVSIDNKKDLMHRDRPISACPGQRGSLGHWQKARYLTALNTRIYYSTT